MRPSPSSTNVLCFFACKAMECTMVLVAVLLGLLAIFIPCCLQAAYCSKIFVEGMCQVNTAFGRSPHM